MVSSTPSSCCDGRRPGVATMAWKSGTPAAAMIIIIIINSTYGPTPAWGIHRFPTIKSGHVHLTDPPTEVAGAQVGPELVAGPAHPPQAVQAHGLPPLALEVVARARHVTVQLVKQPVK
jgi:hypothetical protein